MSEYWTAQQCADHLNIARGTWTSYVHREQAPGPATVTGQRPVEWDAETVKEWDRNRQTHIKAPDPATAIRSYERATAIHRSHATVAQEANRRRGHALAILHASGMSLRDIGAEVGLSYEGVRLLILAYEEGRSWTKSS